MRFYLEEKETIYFFAAVCLILIIGSGLVFFKLIMPKQKILGSLRRTIKGRQIELARRQSTIQQNVRLKEDFLRLNKSYETYTDMLFLKEDVALVVKGFTNLSKNLKIEFVSIQPLPSKLVEGIPDNAPFFLRQMPVVLKMKADYPELLKFLGRLEKASKLMKIENLKIMKNNTTPFMHDIEVTLDVYSAAKNTVKKNEAE